MSHTRLILHKSPTIPTTTLPVSPPTTAAPPPPTPTTLRPAQVPTTTTVPRATPRVVSAPGVLPANIAPQPNFLLSCSGAQYDDSPACVDATLQAIANGRSHEGLPPMVLPSNWDQLSPDQQLFVATNLERTARGLPADVGDGHEPSTKTLHKAPPRTSTRGPPSGFPYSQWGSNWAGAVGNPLEAIYLWMYDDGEGTANIDCTPSKTTGCWGHRENILLRLPCTSASWAPGGTPSDTAGTRA